MPDAELPGAEPPERGTARQAWMSVLARAPAAELERLSAGLLPAWTRLRGPEVGLVMLQGRAGGTGPAFNAGEATVVRCAVRTGAADGDGVVGHAYCLGRDLVQAELAAVLDAALQDPARHDAVQAAVIGPLAAMQGAARAEVARRAAATQVQFFTMATMRS
jgi:alpha-D-ribose 1-methylphosphonate 5-triphosphate synthase subunit PhnG